MTLDLADASESDVLKFIRAMLRLRRAVRKYREEVEAADPAGRLEVRKFKR